MKRYLLFISIILFLCCFVCALKARAQAITTSAATGNISACAGTASASPKIQQITVAGTGLTAGITVAAPAGFEVSLAAGSGYSNSVSLTEVAGTVSNTAVYVRSAATAPAGGITGKVTLSSTGAPAQTAAVTGFINAVPTVDKINGQVVNNGAPTAAVNFAGTANTFNWVNNTPSIGLAASGTGYIASFTAVNTGSTPVTATIKVTPSSNGLAYIANAGSNSVSVINTNTNTVVATIPVGDEPNGISVSPDGSRIYVGNEGSSSISVINTTTNAVVATIPVGTLPLGILVSPDGSKVYVVNNSSASISVINTATNAVSSTIPLDSSSPEYIATNTDGSMLYVTNYQSNSVSVISTASNAVVSTITVGSSPFSISASPDGSKVYVSNFSSNNVSVINTSTNTVVATIPVGILPFGITVSPDGRFVYVANSGDGTVSVINTATNAVVGTVTVGTAPYGVSVSPDDAQLYVSNSSSNNVSIINTTTNSVAATLTVGSRPVSVGNFITKGTGCAGAPATFTIEVDPTPIITAGAVTGSISACSGSASISPNIQQFTVSGINLTGNITATAPAGGQFEVSLAAGSGYGSTVLLMPSAGVVTSTAVYVRSSSSAAPGNISGNIALSSPGATSQNVAVAGIVTASTIPLVSITASANNICDGTQVTFTAIPVNGGAKPVYKWLLNGNNAGTNNAAFISGTLANGDIVSCIMTSGNACSTPTDATSNSIAMTVIAPVAPLVSIATPAVNICAGSPVTFTATPINGGVAPVYQWMVNGNNSGTNTSTYTSSAFADGDIVSCLMTSNAACATPVSATSNSITLKVNLLPVVNCGGNQTITAGNSIQLNATATGNIAGIAWSPATGLSNFKILGPVASPTATTTYTLTVQTTDGCISTADVTITVLPPSIGVPNAFTPNGDGTNDTWDIKHIDFYPNCTVMVFNRWGQNVYSSIGYGIPWDGTYRGARLPTATYYYIINLKNGLKALSGYVVIVR